MYSPPLFNPTAASEAVSAYNQQGILRELRVNPPELFIDAVDSTSRFLADFSFKKFSDIAAFVNANYVPLTTQYDQRYYLRRDLAARRHL